LTFHELAAELEDAGSSLDAVVGELVAGGSLDRGSLLALLEPKLTEPSGILAELPR
jgi:hypothetical protein